MANDIIDFSAVLSAIETEAPFGCMCGESFFSAEGAWNCHNCRDYLEPDVIIDHIYFQHPDGHIEVIRRE